MLRHHLILGTKDKKAQTLLFREKNVDLNIAVNCLQTNKLAQQQLKKINSTTFENVNFSKKKKDQQCDKKDGQASCDISCKFCSKKHEFGKKLCPAWGKECKLCKTKNHFKGSLVWKESKNQKGSKKNNSTNFTENNDYNSDESLFTVTQYVNQVDKPGQPIVS